MLKSFFLSQKKLLNAILRAKLNYMKNVFFLMKWTVFCNAEDRFHEFELFAEKVIFRSLDFHGFELIVAEKVI